MRRFIRHPSDMPISFTLGKSREITQRLKDIGVGGLCFCANEPLPVGSEIRIEIPVKPKPFAASGTVVWSRKDGKKHSVGIEFCDKSVKFGLRMVEQVCHIEHYRSMIRKSEGRNINSEQAAQEWVAKYADTFPYV